jgi:hypothetical protein
MNNNLKEYPSKDLKIPEIKFSIDYPFKKFHIMEILDKSNYFFNNLIIISTVIFTYITDNQLKTFKRFIGPLNDNGFLESINCWNFRANFNSIFL